MNAIRHWLREPLLHFVVAGFVLFVASELRGTAGQDDARIVVTPEREARLATRYAMQFGAPPDATKMAQLVDDEIQEEILFRRGIELGLDRDDEIVRRRIVQKMQFLLEDLSAPAEPSETELNAFFDKHAERYTTPARASFTHVYFSLQQGETKARSRAQAALTRLEHGVDPMQVGDPFPDLYHFATYESEQVRRLFGNSEFASAVFSAPSTRWVGPYRSSYGWHLLKVDARQDAARPTLAEVRDRVRTDFLLDAQARTNQAALSALASEYQVVRTKL
ncbi:peptidyl-prolyl cis-trans isomerase [Steroidobacter flavus]|uniref:peptidylprolyl isomerase n=1 Tax=Steroidobacter flavus TaxID=1842136 RepID=A0ABV8SXT0_9GAMM